MLRDVPEPWPIVASAQEFDGALVGVRRDTVNVDGDTFEREVITHPGAVAIAALDADERLLVITQYRHPARERMIELPAGLLDVDGELPLDAAKRELVEEGHVSADRWTKLFVMMPSAGISTEQLHVYLAEGIHDAEQEANFTAQHEEATMTRQWIPLSEVVEAVLAGTVKNATAVAGSLAIWALRHGNAQSSGQPTT